MSKRVLLYLGICLLLSSSALVMAMEPDARSFAMGGAYTAVVNDASAVYWNPARIPLIGITSVFASGGVASEDFDKTMEAYDALMSNEPLAEIDANGSGAAMAAISTRWVGAGVYGNFGLDVEADSEINLSAETYTVSSAVAGSARVNGVVAAAKSFNLFNLGLAVKAVSDGRYEKATIETQSGPSSQVTAQIHGTGYSVDLALSTSLTPIIQFGAVAEDLISSVEYEKTIDGGPTTTYTDSLDPTFRAGVALHPGLGFTVAGDITSNGDIHLGVEKNTLFNALSLRAGMVKGDETEYRAGLGLNLAWVHLDLGVGFAKDTPAGVMLDASVSF